MITGVKITGFQSHVNSYFNLGPGLNVITGPSDSGKTAIIRAVKWVAFNEPTGEAFVNQTVGEAEVQIELDNGVTISKKRRKGKTSYQLSTIPEPFEKSEVPYEIKEALGIVKQTFGDFVTALNFAFQLEAPFLISETASAGAKILGKLAGTEAVDLAIKDVSKDTYAARQDKTAAEKEIEKIEVQLSEYRNLEEIKEQLAACEYLAEQIEAEASKVDKLKQLKINFGTLTEQLERHEEKLARLVVVDGLEDALKDVEAAQARKEALVTIFNSFGKATAALKAAEAQLTITEGVEALAAQLQSVEVDNKRLEALNMITAKQKVYTAVKTDTEEKLEKLVGLPEAEELLEGIRKATERQKLLQDNKIQYDYLYKTIERRGEDLARFDKLHEADNILQSTANDRQRLETLKTLRARYLLNRTETTQAAQKVEAATMTLKEAENALAAAWEATGGICPLCEQPIDGGHSH